MLKIYTIVLKSHQPHNFVIMYLRNVSIRKSIDNCWIRALINNWQLLIDFRVQLRCDRFDTESFAYKTRPFIMPRCAAIFVEDKRVKTAT